MLAAGARSQVTQNHNFNQAAAEITGATIAVAGGIAGALGWIEAAALGAYAAGCAAPTL